MLAYQPYRVRCGRCGVRVEQVPWAAQWARVTTALARAVAAHFGLDWKTVAAIIREAVARGLSCCRWRPLPVLGIDEVSRAKGQRYLTLVYDLERHRLVWAGEGRTRDTIAGFFRWLGRRRGRSVQIVCCDMWDPYVEAVQTHLPTRSSSSIASTSSSTSTVPSTGCAGRPGGSSPAPSGPPASAPAGCD